MPKLSVIVSVHNGASRLEDSLRSVLAQTFSDFELIVVDDGSTDDTPAILARLNAEDPRVRVLRQPNRGLAASLNSAAALAAGDYVARHDADDVSARERFGRQVRHLDEHPTVAALGTRASVIDDRGHVIGTLPWLQGPHSIRRALSSGRNPLVHGSMMMRRSALIAAGGYREAFHACQDYDLWLRLVARDDIDNLPEGLYEWRLHEASVYATGRARQLQFFGVALAFAREREATGRDSYDLLCKAGSDLNTFAAKYSRSGRVYAIWGELLLRGLGNSAVVRGHLRRALSRGSIAPRTLCLFVWTHLGLPWPGRPLALKGYR